MIFLKTLILFSSFEAIYNIIFILICDLQSEKNDLKTNIYNILYHIRNGIHYHWLHICYSRYGSSQQEAIIACQEIYHCYQNFRHQ